jgi:hypothetical protein
VVPAAGKSKVVTHGVLRDRVVLVTPYPHRTGFLFSHGGLRSGRIGIGTKGGFALGVVERMDQLMRQHDLRRFVDETYEFVPYQHRHLGVILDERSLDQEVRSRARAECKIA